MVYRADCFAQTQGSLIPNGQTVFLDNNGKPLSSGQVFFYTQGTTTPKTTYKDINQTVPNTNPVILDASGRPSSGNGIWGVGTYRQIVEDKNNNLIWDVTTSTAGTAATGPTATGDGDAVGTIKPWAGITPPNQYMFTYGQALNRVTYAPLFQAITSTQSVFCSSGSPTITGLSDTNSFWIGMSVELSCVPAGFTTITAKTSSSVTLAVNANASVNINAVFFPWGNGDHSTTFNLPDYRGLIPMGNNIMGGVASSNISDANFGAASASSSGGQGGAQTNSVTLLATNLPSNIPYTDPGHSHAVGSNGGGTNTNGSASSFVQAATDVANVGTISQTIGITINPSGNVPFTTINIPPSKTVNFIIKVTPDAAFSGTGVTSLGGMTGDIVCGTNITCSGNTISIITPGLTSVAINQGTGTLLSGTCSSITAINCTVSTTAKIQVSGNLTFYISTSGNDLNDGSIGSPWASCSHAISATQSGYDLGNNVANSITIAFISNLFLVARMVIVSFLVHIQAKYHQHS